MFKTRKGLFVILLLFLLSGGWTSTKDWFVNHNRSDDTGSVVLTASAQKHILYGDKRGGGHKYGTGKPCKSEFPADWDNEQILTTVKRMAANDNAGWEEQDNGYYVSEQFSGNMRIRVVLNRNKDEIVTAYPVNVKRNPCNVPANDNFNQ